ncbi:MAG: hypothetical protein WBB27_16155, partial [Maribacter sp.]
MKRLIIFYMFLATGLLQAQIESGLLFGLTKGTSSEISSISGMEEGQMLYNTDTKELVVYNGIGWSTTASSNWLFTGNVLNTGAFLGSTNDVGMEIRSNNIGLIQVGRRQTLGLTQTYTDYSNNDQYLTYIKGANGVSALQFQADAAEFYKPMFFTTPNGNFRLKGSAAQTDFFEIGSAGVSNAGVMEFIIGDDGAEPFIFKRYDYRDQLYKELFRIQGSSDSQNALPRIGVNTGQLANSTLQVSGSVATAITAINGNLTLDETHHTLIVNSNSTISLPPANTCSGRLYVIKNTTNAAINISSYLNGSGNGTVNIPANSTVQIQSNGTSWHAISAGSLTVISSDTDNLIVTGNDGGAFLKINQGARWTNSDIVTDLNAGSVAAPIFGNQDYNDDPINLYVVTSNTLTVREAGRYDIRANLSLLGINSGGNQQRTNVNAQITINGNPVGALAASGYIRFASGHEQSSIHINEILQLNANDVI